MCWAGFAGRCEAAAEAHRCLSKGSRDLQACLHFLLILRACIAESLDIKAKLIVRHLAGVPAVPQLRAWRGAGETGLAPWAETEQQKFSVTPVKWF